MYTYEDWLNDLIPDKWITSFPDKEGEPYKIKQIELSKIRKAQKETFDKSLEINFYFYKAFIDENLKKVDDPKECLLCDWVVNFSVFSIITNNFENLKPKFVVIALFYNIIIFCISIDYML